MGVGISDLAITLTAVDDTMMETTQDVTISITAPLDMSYSVGTPSSAVIHIIDNDGGLPGGGGGSGPSPVVISQIYGAGGELDALFNQDFIELFNSSTSSVSLSGWSVQYAATASSTWSVIPLSGSLASGQYLLIGAASGGTVGANLPTPDLTSTAALAAAGGKVALVDSTMALMGATPALSGVKDFVGYGDADWFEGYTGTAPETDFEMAALRLGHGNYDTDDNSWDFYADEPDPRNSNSATANLKPTITVPENKFTALNAPFTFSTMGNSAITIGDPDAGTSSLEVSLTGYNGTLTLASTTGLTFSVGDGTSDETMTFTASLTSIASAVNGLVFTPASGFEGWGSTMISVSDQGNTGAGGELLEITSASLVVGGQVVAIDDEIETDEDTEVEIDVLSNDAWVNATLAGSGTPTVTVLTSPAHGEADVVDGVITYTPDPEYHGTDSFTYLLDNLLGHTSSATVTLTVNWVNDAEIATTGEPFMYADEAELIDVRFDTPDATEALTWTATGLPSGLVLHSALDCTLRYARPIL